MKKKHHQIIRFTVLSGVEHLEIWFPFVRDDGLSLSTDDGLNVSVNATKLAVWKSVALGDDGNLGVNAKELVRWKLVSPEDGLTFSVETDALAN